jgi:penicillin amidase
MFPRFVFGFGYLVLLLVAGLLVLGIYFKSGTVPSYSGTATVSGISGTIDIDRDGYAIPHIHATTERDAYFGLGYAEAQDRLFQMEVERRLGAGRMSEVFGNRSLAIDRWSRTIGFSRIAGQMWLKAGTHTREVLTAFVSGINAYLKDHRKHLGFEFDALTLVPEDWRPQDCLVIGRLMAWELNFSALTDAAYSDFSLALDSAHFTSLLPVYPEDGATVLGGANPSTFVSNYLTTPRAAPTIVRAPVKPIDTTQKPQAAPKLSLRERVGSQDDFASLFRQVNQFDSMAGACVGGGSNSFAIAGSHTAKGSAILENDTHLQLQSPSRWYVAHLVSDDGLNVAGFLIPGMPVVLSGRTADLSWGITNGSADECDYFVERYDSASNKYQLPNGSWQDFTVIHDTIRVRDSAQMSNGGGMGGSSAIHPIIKVPITIRMSIHGPVISGLHPQGMESKFYGDARAGGVPENSIFNRDSHPVSMMWNGTYALTDELAGFIDLVHAKTVQEARKGMSGFATPCLNLCLADARGNISYQFIGRLPRRSGSETRQMLPRDGTNPTDAWTGFVSMSELPTITNPPRGYIVSANNPPMKDRSIPFGMNWEPSSRADRISELLEEHPRLGEGSVQSIQTDIISAYDLHRVLPYLLALYPDPDPPRLSADSTSEFRMDSMRIYWKEDSLTHHTSISDSAMKYTRKSDSVWVSEHRQLNDRLHSKSEPLDPFTAQVLNYLRNWDGGMRSEEIAPAIYSVFLNCLIYNTFYEGLLGNEPSPARYGEFILLQNIPLEALAHILPDSANVWWHSGIGGVNGRDAVIQRSFRESLRMLAQRFGSDIRQWQWGKLHTLTMRHLFDKESPLIAQLVDVVGGPMPGGPTTVSQASYYLWNPYQMQVGPSMRMVADMSNDVLLGVLPSGNSEAMFGDHYHDMLPLYQRGTLTKISLDKPAVLGDKWSRFELKPE